MKRVVALNVAALWLLLNTSAVAQTPTVGSRRSIDIAVTRYVVDRTGERVGMPAETIRYRMSRVKTDDGWKTVMTLGAPDGASRDEVARNPFYGGRVEFDEAGRFAMFDKAGREIPPPRGLQMPPLPILSADWSASLDVISTASRSRETRVHEVEAKYGRPVSTVRGLSQYMRRNGETVEEVLFDRELGIPVELNVMQGERLTAHIAFAYVERPGRGIVRRAMRSELVLDQEGHRAVTATEFSNLLTEEER